MATMVVSRKVTSLERQDQVFIIQQMQCLLLPSLCCLLEEDSGLILLTSSSSLVSTKVRVLFVVCILLVFVLYAQLGLFFTFFSLVFVIWVSLFLFQAKIF
jgi:hypothetical protein